MNKSDSFSDSDENISAFEGTPQALESASRTHSRRLSLERSITNAEDENFVEDGLVGSTLLYRHLSKKSNEEGALPELVPVSSLPSIYTKPTKFSSTIHGFGKRHGLWTDAEFKTIKVLIALMTNYMLLVICFLFVFSVYWTGYFNKSKQFVKAHYAIVIADQGFDNTPSAIGPVVNAFFTDFEPIQQYGTYDILNMTEFGLLAKKYNNTFREEVIRQVHHQRYYGAYFVAENATQLFLNGTNDDLIEMFFETGRDFNAYALYLENIFLGVAEYFTHYLPQTPLYGQFVSQLNNTQKMAILENPNVVTSLPTIKVTDLLPVTKMAYQACFQVGLIYLIVFAFFQFLLMFHIHVKVAEKVKGNRYIAYRLAIGQLGYLIISFFFVILNRAFGMPYDVTFGKSGFLVIWAFAFLTMSSLGSLIEALVFLSLPSNTHFAGLIIVVTVVLNLSPPLATITLSPNFYKYGYAIPVYNAYKLMHVAYFNAWKGNMGRYIGVLLVWITLTNIFLPFIMKRSARKKEKLDQEILQEMNQEMLQENIEKD